MLKRLLRCFHELTLPKLNADEQDALDSLPDDFIERIVNGDHERLAINPYTGESRLLQPKDKMPDGWRWF